MPRVPFGGAELFADGLVACFTVALWTASVFGSTGFNCDAAPRCLLGHRKLRSVLVARARERWAASDLRGSMSDLVPNLEDLRSFLSDIDSAPDAHAFLDRLSEATTFDGAVAKVDALVDEWLAVPSE